MINALIIHQVSSFTPIASSEKIGKLDLFIFHYIHYLYGLNTRFK